MVDGPGAGGPARTRGDAEIALHTHRDYVHAVTSATQEAVDAGFLLPIDGDAIIAEAERIAIPDYRNAMERSTHGSGDGIGAG